MPANSFASSVSRSLAVCLLAVVSTLPQVSPARADTTDVDVASGVDTTSGEVAADTLLFEPPSDESAAGQVTNPINLEKHLYQNPTGALFKSMLVPGLGQLGNRRYFKAAVFIGLECWFAGSAIHYGRQAADAKDVFASMPTTPERNYWYAFYDNKRKNRNKFTWFAGITIFISMFDAFVDAHLSGSPTDERNEQFTLDVIPDQFGGVSAVATYSF